MTQTEALRLALDALECWQRNEDCNEPRSKIIGAIKAALEAKDEIVEWKMGVSGIGGTGVIVQPQRKWVGLTDEEIWETISRIGTSDSDVNPYAKLADARAIEAKLKEKNT